MEILEERAVSIKPCSSVTFPHPKVLDYASMLTVQKMFKNIESDDNREKYYST
jgi:hypothetical protein